MKKVIRIIIGLLCIFSGIWTFLRVMIFHVSKVPFYRSIPSYVGPILFIVGVVILAIGYGIEHKMKPVIKVTLGISFIVYLLILVEILFFESSGFRSNMQLLEYIKELSNITPFKTIATYVNALFDGSMNMTTPITNLAGNFILFLPMGIYLPYFIKKIDKINTYCICMIIILFLVEIVQLVARRGVFDIDDIILRILGALIGYLIWKTEVVQKNLSVFEKNADLVIGED